VKVDPVRNRPELILQRDTKLVVLLVAEVRMVVTAKKNWALRGVLKNV